MTTRPCPSNNCAAIFVAEAPMILVRDVFQVKFGRMKEARDVWKDMFKVMPAGGAGRGDPASGSNKPRLLTDLTGQYYTLVLESTFKDLTDYEAFSRKEMAAIGPLYQKFVPLVDSGHREIFTIVE
jgi:hypothetical protein